MAKSRITINGVTIEVEGSNVSVRNGTIYVDGATVQSGLSGDVHIIWEGDLARLEADGSVTCRNVHGDVTAGGSVQCKDISGKISAGGSVKASKCGGSINAGGSVRIN